MSNLKAEIFTTIAKLKSHPHYMTAKAGDRLAAWKLANELINKDKAEELITSLKDGTNIVPVAAVEHAGMNQIPNAIASVLSAVSTEKDTFVDNEIIQINNVFHTGAGAMERLISKPFFEGTVYKGEPYFLVDDVVTTGSSLNELRLYIEKNGGSVVGCACLGASYSRIYGHSSQISMERDTINEIIRKFDIQELNQILKRYGYQDYKELTNGQGKFIASFKSIDNLRKRIVKAEDERSKRNIQRTFEGESKTPFRKRNRGLKR